MQIFTGLLYEQFDSLTITDKKKLNMGGFGEIYKVQIKELNTSDNVIKVPIELSEKQILYMFNEFKLV